MAFLAAACGDNDNSTKRQRLSPEPQPTATTVAPNPTPTAPPQIPCPELITYTIVSQGSDLDIGWTGIYHDQVLGSGGSLSFTLDCAGQFLGQCGDCALAGPIASTTIVNNHRWANGTQTKCTANDACGTGTCEFFFGAPLPISGAASRSASPIR